MGLRGFCFPFSIDISLFFVLEVMELITYWVFGNG